MERTSLTTRRIFPGVYETADGRHRIHRTPWEGPHGGVVWRWEISALMGDEWTLDAEVCGERFPTKRAALDHLRAA